MSEIAKNYINSGTFVIYFCIMHYIEVYFGQQSEFGVSVDSSIKYIYFRSGDARNFFKKCWVDICFPGSDVYVCTYVKNLICISFFFRTDYGINSVLVLYFCAKKCWFILSVPDWVWLKRTINKSKSIGSYHLLLLFQSIFFPPFHNYLDFFKIYYIMRTKLYHNHFYQYFSPL